MLQIPYVLIVNNSLHKRRNTNVINCLSVLKDFPSFPLVTMQCFTLLGTKLRVQTELHHVLLSTKYKLKIPNRFKIQPPLMETLCARRGQPIYNIYFDVFSILIVL